MFENYEVVGGYLRPAGEYSPPGVGLPRAGSYRPQDHEALPFAIAKLVDASDADLVRFARQWGMLGYERLWWHDNPVDSPTSTGEGDRGDPLDWIQFHARYIALSVALVDGLSRNDAAAIRQAVEKYLEPDVSPRVVQGRLETPDISNPRAWGLRRNPYRWSDTESPTRQTWARPSGSVEWAVWGERLRSDPFEAARLALQYLVTRHIQGISSWLNYESGKPIFQFSFRAMVEVAYLHVAHLAMAGELIDRCEECGAPFKKEHGLQRFCAPGPYDSESRCSYRHRYRKYRTARATKANAPTSKRRSGKEPPR